MNSNEFDLEYNSDREKLIIPEYGRHMQKLVNHCKELESKEERNEMAHAIIDVMGNLQPHLRDVPDFKHKLWDQLFIMADFDLDVDSPYPTPLKEDFAEKPEALKYPETQSKYRFYGRNIQKMIDTAVEWEDGELKDALIYAIANHMKKCYLNWNKDTVEDSLIFHHLNEMSDGKIDLKPDDETLAESRNLIRKKHTDKSRPQKSKRGRRGRK